MSPPAGFPKISIPQLRARIDATVSALKAVGESVSAVDVQADGSFRVLTGPPEPQVTVGQRVNTVEAILRRAG